MNNTSIFLQIIIAVSKPLNNLSIHPSIHNCCIYQLQTGAVHCVFWSIYAFHCFPLVLLVCQIGNREFVKHRLSCNSTPKYLCEVAHPLMHIFSRFLKVNLIYNTWTQRPLLSHTRIEFINKCCHVHSGKASLFYTPSYTLIRLLRPCKEWSQVL